MLRKFTDQFFNSLLVRRNNFGKVLLKEDFSHEKLKHMVTKMLRKQTEYAESMIAASHAVLKDPTTPQDNLVFHCNQLMEFGDLGYLRNEVIVGQTMVEIYNIDILAVFIFSSLLALLIVCTVGKKVITFGWAACKKTQGIETREKAE